MIQLPNGFANQIAASSTEFFAELSPLTILIASILLGAVVLTVIIGAIKH